MNQGDFTDQLKDFFSKRVSPDTSAIKMRRTKAFLLDTINDLKIERVNDEMLTRLRRYYRGYTEIQKSNVKSFVMNQLPSEEMITMKDTVLSYAYTYSRKAMAMGFAFLLVFTTFLGPFQTLRPLQMISVSFAAYMECSGKVFLNGNLCNSDVLIQVNPGDVINTDSEALAILFYSDDTIVRLNDSTRATLDLRDKSQIHLTEGNMWLHSPGETNGGALKVDTSVIRAKVPQGAAGVSTRGSLTQLYTTTAAVEVQINGTPGTTELMTVAPEMQLQIRKTRNNARIQESSLTDRIPEWVRDNKIKDEEHMQIVKQRTLENTLAGAGVLPGSVQDYLQKITQSARTVLTWDERVRLNRQLTELDELFSESMILLENGDITTAEETFKAYQQKFTSIVVQNSDTIRVEISNTRTDSFGELLRYHSRLVSQFTPEDDEYVLKQVVEELAINLSSNINSEISDSLIVQATTNKLLLAHQSVLQGNENLAEEILLEAVEFVSKVLPEVPMAVSMSDLTLLSNLSEKSNKLSVLAKEIKRMKVDQMRSLTPKNQTSQTVAKNVAGMAYKPIGQTDQNNIDSMVKVVGQAVKEEEDAL